MIPAKGYAAQSSTLGLTPFSFERNVPREKQSVLK